MFSHCSNSPSKPTLLCGGGWVSRFLGVSRNTLRISQCDILEPADFNHQLSVVEASYRMPQLFATGAAQHHN